MDRGDDGWRRGAKERDGWMDGGEWAGEVSVESDADQQRARGGRGSDPDGKVFWQANPRLARNRNCQR